MLSRPTRGTFAALQSMITKLSNISRYDTADREMAIRPEP